MDKIISLNVNLINLINEKKLMKTINTFILIYL